MFESLLELLTKRVLEKKSGFGNGMKSLVVYRLPTFEVLVGPLDALRC